MSTVMSVTRALATLKSLDSKLERGVDKLTLVATTAGTGSSLAVNGTNKALGDVEAQIKNDWTSFQDILKLRTALKNAVIQSNAVTMVTIGSTEMTVAQAIESKKSIVVKSQLLVHLRRQMLQWQNEQRAQNLHYEAKIEAATGALAGKDKRVSEEEVATVTKPIELRQKPGAVDPLDLSKVIETLTTEIEDFMLNVDFALSEINAKTEITVE